MFYLTTFTVVATIQSRREMKNITVWKMNAAILTVGNYQAHREFAPLAIWPPQTLHGLGWYRNRNYVTVVNVELIIPKRTA